jgi:hypothetical protein
MDLSKLETVEDLMKIIRVGTVLVNTYLGTEQEPYGYENGEVLYPDDFHVYFIVEKFNEGSLDGKEWDDFNIDPSPRWIAYNQLDPWEIYKY